MALGHLSDTYLLSLDAASLRLEPSWPPGKAALLIRQSPFGVGGLWELFTYPRACGRVGASQRACTCWITTANG